MSEVIVITPGQLEQIISEVTSKSIQAALQAQQTALTHPPRAEYISKQEAAKLLGVSIRTLELRMASGAVRYTKNGNSNGPGRVQILSEDVYRLLNASTVDNRCKR
jgi:hypothetical protein